MSPNWKNYAGKILRRCGLCGKFQATYRVEDAQLGSLILCQNCWTRRMAAHPPRLPEAEDVTTNPSEKKKR